MLENMFIDFAQLKTIIIYSSPANANYSHGCDIDLLLMEMIYPSAC